MSVPGNCDYPNQSRADEGITSKTENPSSAVGTPPTKEQLLLEKAHFGVLCLNLFLIGWNDGTTGPLLPSIKAQYNVNFTIVSLLFIFIFVGALVAALINVHLLEKLGFGKVMVFGSLLSVTGFALLAPALPFPVFVLAYALIGMGISMQDAQCSGYVAMMPRGSTKKMGYAQAIYGTGALVGPIVSTQFSKMAHWNYHYLTSEGLAVLILCLHVAIFQGRRQEDCLAKIGKMRRDDLVSDKDAAGAKFRKVFRTKTMYLLAFFLFLYIGIGNTISGWIVTYLQLERNGTASSGYVSAGYYAGIVAGRIVLLPLNKKFGERRAVFAYIIFSLAVQLVIWLVPNFYAAATCVGVMGFFNGPLYPVAMNHAARVIEDDILIPCIGVMAAFGFSGSAVFPFITGALSNEFGVKSMNPLCVALCCGLFVIWWLVPAGPAIAPHSGTQSETIEMVDAIRKTE